MTILDYINNKKELHNHLLSFIDDDSNESFEKLNIFFEKEKLHLKREELKNMLYFIYKLTKNHHRSTQFFSKIDQILFHFRDAIKQTFSNLEIFNFFQNNKRILLFLFENKIIIPDKPIIDQIIDKSYSKDKTYRHFFITEIKNFLDEKTVEVIEKEITQYDENFYEKYEEKRKKGENENYICKLIQTDSVEDFVSYVNRINFHISSTKIYPSIFETNSFLIKKNVSLIEYAAFYGSIQIFQYLYLNNVEINQNLWLFAIHGRRPELIHFLEENHINPPNNSYVTCLKEALKCHHNEIADYFIENYIKDDIYSDKFVLSTIFRYYNYFYFHIELNQKVVFNCLCQYDYFTLVKLFINEFKSSIIEKKFIDVINLHLIAKRNNFTILNFLMSQIKIEIEKNCFNECKKLTQIQISPLTTIIGSESFNNCTSLKKIDIPNSIKSIGFSAFNNCKSLEKITIPPLITTITDSLFNNCSSLIEITIPSSVKLISNFAFSGCSSLKTITIPPSVTRIGQNSFSRCSSLIEITIPSLVKSIDHYTFNECKSMKKITILSSLNSIGYCSFGNCCSLEEIQIPSSVKSIDSFAFSGCSSLKNIILPFINKIESNAFYNCSSLEKISIPSSVTSIEYSAFYGCSSLCQINIPDSVKYISSRAFACCLSLKEILIPKSVIKIDDFAFEGCSSLQLISLPSSINIDNLKIPSQTIIFQLNT